MQDNKNTIFGWILFSGIIALGVSILSGKFFHADNAPEMEQNQFGLWVEAADESGGGPAEMSMAEALNMMPQDELVAAGEKVFAKCSSCHTVNQGGANGIGPNLYGIMGSPIGKHAAGFAYSSDLASKGGNWDWDSMNAWLKNPKAFAAGTKMAFAGLGKIEDRAAVALYLNSLGSNQPVPEYVAEVAEGANADGEGEETVEGAGTGPGAVAGEEADAVEAAGGAGAEQPVPSNPAAGD